MKKEEQHKTFISKSGMTFNYDFVPAKVTTMYQEYMEKVANLTPEIQRYHAILRDEDKRKEVLKSEKSIKEFNALGETIKVKATEGNRLGLDIIMLVLGKNKQAFELTEDFILEEMSVDDMNEIIKLFVS